jgi:hypothetical protein
MGSPKIFITGIPTAGKSYLAKKLAKAINGIAVNLDNYRDSLESDERYRRWINFYFDQDEEKYVTTISPDEMWKNLVAQSEALWPAFLEKIATYKEGERPVIFECVNLLPHLAHRDLTFPGITLIGRSYEETLERNRKEPRWSNDSHPSGTRRPRGSRAMGNEKLAPHRTVPNRSFDGLAQRRKFSNKI